MSRTKAPPTLTLCAGRLVGVPVVIKVTLYNGHKVPHYLGRRWTLDGAPIRPEDAHVFRYTWTDGSAAAAA